MIAPLILTFVLRTVLVKEEPTAVAVREHADPVEITAPVLTEEPTPVKATTDRKVASVEGAQPAPIIPAPEPLKEDDVVYIEDTEAGTHKECAYNLKSNKAWPCFRQVSRSMRQARCSTALCWGSDNFFALEPMLELPVGGMAAFRGKGEDGALSKYINSNTFTVSVAAGVRFWFAWDIVSFSVYYSKLIPTEPNNTLSLPGSEYMYAPSQIRRKYPGLAIGLLNDIFFIGIDYNQLRNRSGTDKDPNHLANSVVDSAWTVSIGFAPITLIRNTVGGVKGFTQGKKTYTLKKAKVE